MEALKPFSTKINFIRLLCDLQTKSVYSTVKKALSMTEISAGSRVLDVGCGDSPYKFLFDCLGLKYTGLDWDKAMQEFGYDREDVVHYDGRDFPFEDGEFDLVFHTETAEHIPDIEHFFAECGRILTGGGKMIFSIPFSARYHYIPNDYWRLTPASIEMLCNENGLKVIKIIPRGTDITVARYKVLTVGYRHFFSFNPLKMLWAALFSPVYVLRLLTGQISMALGIGSGDDSLGWTVLAEK